MGNIFQTPCIYVDMNIGCYENNVQMTIVRVELRIITQLRECLRIELERKASLLVQLVD